MTAIRTKTKDYESYMHMVEDVIDRVSTLPRKNRNDLMREINKVLDVVARSVGQSGNAFYDFPNFAREAVQTEGVFNALKINEKGWLTSPDLDLCVYDLVKTHIYKIYYHASLSLKKNTFQQAADCMTKKLKNETLKISATHATEKLYVKKGNRFDRSLESGKFHIDGVRFGPRDGLILQMSKSGSFFELAVKSLPVLESVSLVDGTTKEENEMGFNDNPIFNALVSGMNERTKEEASLFNLYKHIRTCFVDGEFFESEEKVNSSKEVKKDVVNDIRKTVPNFGMWG